MECVCPSAIFTWHSGDMCPCMCSNKTPNPNLGFPDHKLVSGFRANPLEQKEKRSLLHINHNVSVATLKSVLVTSVYILELQILLVCRLYRMFG